MKDTTIIISALDALGRSGFPARNALDRLEARVKELEGEKTGLARAFVEIQMTRSAESADRDRLREAMRKYGRHIEGCSHLMPTDAPRCSCGLWQTIEEGRK